MNNKNAPHRKAERLDPKVKAVVEAAGAQSRTDPQGSYTGNPAREGERPVQDADDL